MLGKYQKDVIYLDSKWSNYGQTLYVSLERAENRCESSCEVQLKHKRSHHLIYPLGKFNRKFSSLLIDIFAWKRSNICWNNLMVT